MADLASEPLDRQSDDGPGGSTGARVAGLAQAVVLVGTSCMSVLGLVLLAPVQPLMAAAFATTPGVEVLVPLAVVMPGLVVALTAPLAGRIADRAGRVRLLTGSLIVYALFGMAPLWLPTLQLVAVSRAGLGLGEAGIITASYALISDMWSGPERARLLGLQVLSASLAAVILVAIGGALGGAGWRTPFWVYAVGLLFALAVPRVLWNPAGLRSGELPPVRWRLLVLPLTLTLLGGIVFYVPLLQLSFVLDGIGVTSSVTIGAVSAAAALSSAVTSGLFGRVAGAGPRVLLPIALGFAGVGVVVLGVARTVPVVVVGAVVCSAGSGLLLPTLLLWALSSLSTAERGRVTGAWMSCVTTAQVACPVIVLTVGAVAGGLPSALVVVGVAALLLAVASSRVRIRPEVTATE